ncbi:hypothetical protein [Granulicella paludicola]|jgi:hypothetical protein|uniref:hypothetical protein n=1 Tax=Granulicella paludicola TaxID=474951 RepID=UPI0021E045BB|nr:hypothetical protein [Granulicella paludicola]
MRKAWLLAVVVAVLAAPGMSAQVRMAHGSGSTTKEADRPQGTSAPLPGQLSQVKRVFLSNGGSDAGLFPHPFTGTQDRAYGYFYAALAGNTRYQLVSQPSQADAVVELALAAPLGSLGGDKSKGTTDPLPTFKLTIYDRPTHYVLWTISQTIDPANLQKTHDKNFDTALDSLLSQFEAVTK